MYAISLALVLISDKDLRIKFPLPYISRKNYGKD